MRMVPLKARIFRIQQIVSDGYDRHRDGILDGGHIRHEPRPRLRGAPDGILQVGLT